MPTQNSTNNQGTGGSVDSVFGRSGVVVAVDNDYTAEQITNVPSGGIASTDVQGALADLDQDKADKTISINAGTGLTGGGDLQASRVLALGTSGVIPGTYPLANVSVDTYGRVTSISNGTVTGDVVGPASSTDNAISRWDGTAGDTLQDSTVTISDAGTINSPALTGSKALIANSSKDIVSSTVTDVELAYLSGTTSSVQTQISAKVAKSGDTMTGALTLAADPVSALQAATKQYADNLAQGIAAHPSAVCASTANLTLSGEQTIDGVLTSASRVLVKDQTLPAQNGVYVTAAGAWTRATDMDSWAEVPGAFIFVTGGTTQGSTGWVCISPTGGTIGVSAITFTQFSSAAAYTADGQGIELTGTQFSLELDGTTLSKSGTGLKVATSGITNNEVSASAALDAAKIGGGLVSNTEFSYLAGLGSSIQTQLNAKQVTVTGAATTITGADLSANLAVISNGAGKIANSTTSATELGYLTGVTSAVQTQLTGKVDKAGDTMTGYLTLVGDPASAFQAATKQYVDNSVGGSPIRAAVACASTANLTLSGEQTIDGILTSASRVLVKNQTSTPQNGIYVSAAGAWTRSTDMDIWSEVPGATTFVTAGTTLGSTGWGCIAATIGTINVTAITWAQVSAPGTYTADGQGIELTGTVFSLELDGTTLAKSGTGLKVNTGGITDTEVSASAAIAATKIGGGAVSDTEFSYLDGVTSAIQTQFSNKQPLDATLTGLAALATGTGFIAQGVTPDTFTVRSIAGGTNITVSDGAGVFGNPGISFQGTLPVASGGTNQTTYTNGQLLIGNTTGNTLTKATLTAGTNVSITNGSGSITINATGSGDVVGPASATDSVPALFDTTSGKLLKNSTPTGTGNPVLQTSPTLTTAVLGSSTATTQTPADNSTKVATTAYVDAAVLGQNFKEACKYGSVAALPAVTYSNGTSGVGATLTAVAFGAVTFDGSTPSIGDRVLVKNQVSTFQNGIYTVTIVGAVATLFVLTRGTDFDQATDIKTGDSTFITAGTTLSTTTFAYTGASSPVMGTDAITFAQTAGQGSFTAGNGIAITGNSIAIDTSITVDKTTVQTLTNKTLTSPTFTAPVLGTPASGTLTNATGLPLTTGVTGNLPVANLNSGTSASVTTFWRGDGSWSTPAGAGDVVGPASATDGVPALFNGTTGKLLKNSTPTGTGNPVLQTSPTLVTPVLGTPASGTLTNATGLPLTTGVTGTLGVANGGTGQTSYTDGQLMIGNTATGLLSKSTLTAGSNVTITNGNGTITIAASGGGGSSAATTNSIAQTAHGFAVGDVIYYTGSAYAKAKADAAATAEVVGIATTITDANNFVMTMEGYCTGLSGLTAGTTYFLSASTAGALTATEPTTANYISKPLLVANSTTTGYLNNWRGAVNSNPTGALTATASGRLTLVTATPVMTASQTGITSVYYTPYTGNSIALYDGTSWQIVSFSEVSLSLSGYTASKNYDIWGYLSSGALVLESTVWTNDTTRATAIALQDGVYVKSGTPTRRLLGTIRINATGGQCNYIFGAIGANGTAADFGVSNVQNQVKVATFIGDSTDTWTYGTTTWRAANGSNTMRCSFVNTLTQSMVESYYNGNGAMTSGPGRVAVGYDSTSTFTGSVGLLGVGGSNISGVGFMAPVTPTPGYHYVQAVERGDGFGTQLWYGDNGDAARFQNGLFASLFL